MWSIKPGRGPSILGGIAGIGAAIFGLFWTITAASMGGGFFALFGIVFIAMAIVNAVYNFKNATSQNRYSMFDITGGGEEPDPLNLKFGKQSYDNNQPVASGESEFCPYCGNRVDDDFEFCNKCGKKLP